MQMGLRWLEGFEHARLAAVMQEANVDLASKTLKTGKVISTHGIISSAYCALHVCCVQLSGFCCCLQRARPIESVGYTVTTPHSLIHNARVFLLRQYLLIDAAQKNFPDSIRVRFPECDAFNVEFS